MPQVRFTSAKGLVQQTGSGFPALDFLMMNEAGLTTTGATTVTDTQADADAAGSTATTKLACTLAPYCLNSTSYDGGANGNIYLPAADEGVHLALKLTGTPAGTNDLTIKAQGSAVEAARVAAGGTAATFAARRQTVENPISGQSNATFVEIVDTDVNLICDFHGSACSFEANTIIHFYCPTAGKWIFKIDNVNEGNGSTFSMS